MSIAWCFQPAHNGPTLIAIPHSLSSHRHRNSPTPLSNAEKVFRNGNLCSLIIHLICILSAYRCSPFHYFFLSLTRFDSLYRCIIAIVDWLSFRFIKIAFCVSSLSIHSITLTTTIYPSPTSLFFRCAWLTILLAKIAICVYRKVFNGKFLSFSLCCRCKLHSRVLSSRNGFK